MMQKQRMSMFWFIFVSGVLLGTIGIQFASPDFLERNGVFSKEWLGRMAYMEVNNTALLWYCIKQRVPVALLLGIFAYSNLAIIISCGYLFWVGCGVGIMISTASMQHGVMGPMLYLVMVFPQYICYGAALILYLLWLVWIQKADDLQGFYSRKIIFGKMVQLLVIFCIVLLGIVTESYVNPFLLTKFAKFFL